MNSSDAALAAFSKLWWGNSVRLQVADWVRRQSSGSAFFQRQIARELNTEPAYVRRELELLSAAGAIRAEEKPPGGRRQFYVTVPDHPIWPVVAAAVTCAGELSLEPS